jgi:hypothetical protein
MNGSVGGKRRLTYANVMATIAVFIALGGTSLAASYLVNSNSQVGPNVIAGHAAPSGKHANLIPGSVSARDLKVGTTIRTATLPAGSQCPASSTEKWAGTIQYGRDVSGFVHLAGHFHWCGGFESTYPTVYTLPLGYRPQQSMEFAPAESTLAVTIAPSGAVSAGQFGELDGATFRCYPSRQYGCP